MVELLGGDVAAGPRVGLLDFSSGEDPSIGVTASGALVVGSLDALTVSDPSMCAFATAGAPLTRRGPVGRCRPVASS